MDYGLLSRRRSELMGAAILWVMFFHALDLDLGTVKSRIARAREKMRKYLLRNGNFSAYAPSNVTERAGKEGQP